MWPARDTGVAKLSITSIDTSLAGTNRSGKQRLLPDLAGASDSESAASQSRAGTTADPPVVACGGDHQPPGQEVVETDQLLVNSEREETMSAASEAAEAAAAAAALAGENVLEIVGPSPTNFDPSRMPKTVKSKPFIRARQQAYSSRVLISKLMSQGNAQVEELRELEEERGEGES